MALDYINISLRAWTQSKDCVPDGVFLDQLNCDSPLILEVSPSRRAWESALVVLCQRELKNFSGEEKHDHFQQAIFEDLTKSAEWLTIHPPELFREMRNSGLKIDIITTGWIDCDQLDLSFPSKFLAACGERDLSITIITNE